LALLVGNIALDCAGLEGTIITKLDRLVEEPISLDKPGIDFASPKCHALYLASMHTKKLAARQYPEPSNSNKTVLRQ
jgi:hypothetical protein